MIDLYVFDLDGTLADLTHRLPLITPPAKKDWKQFFELCEHDKPIDWVINLNRLVFHSKYGKVVILSGRMNTVREKTENWLDKHYVRYHELIMREAGDYRCDTIVKAEMMDKLLSLNDYNLQFIVDDRQRVVDMWRARGYNVLQCNAWKEVEGTYEKE